MGYFKAHQQQISKAQQKRNEKYYKKLGIEQPKINATGVFLLCFFLFVLLLFFFGFTRGLLW
jgi:hypothetical protein